MKLIVGLGNPGARYQRTRHNVGFLVVDHWLHQRGERPLAAGAPRRCGAVACLKPDTLMNASGPAVARAAAHYDSAPEELLVICDDLNLPLGQLRLRGRGSAGGHHGLESIIAALGATAFARLRLGIGVVPPGTDATAFVLSPFTAAEQRVMDEAVVAASAAVDVWMQEGVTAAMNRFNRRVT